jgi:hypothetical protein
VTPLPRRPITAFTARLLALYRGEPAPLVLERAMRMLASADGHLRPDGQIVTQRILDAEARRPS